nr:fringe-related family protein [Ipomoea batatas]
MAKFMVWLILFVSATYVVYTLKLVSSSRAWNDDIFPHRHSTALPIRQQINSTVEEGDARIWRSETSGLEHIVFSIAASAKLWDKRKNYTKLPWKLEEKMRGIVWLDKAVKTKEIGVKGL